MAFSFLRRRHAGADEEVVETGMPAEDDAGAPSTSAMLTALGAIHERQYAQARDLGLDAGGELGAAVAAIANMLEYTFKTLSLRGSALSIETSESMIAVSRMGDNIRTVGENTAKIATATEELSGSFHEVTRASETAANEARVAREDSDSSLDEVERARISMEKIAAEVRGMTGRISVLQEAVNQIAEMTRTIEDISNQTNLLALNATIEAARAGEAGKGFAVVAAEVKTLSQQTANATVQISERTDALRAEMQQMMAMIESSTAAVVEGEEIIVNVSQRFHSVSDRITDVSGNIGQIAGTLSQQAGATDEISAAINRIADRAQSNREAVSKITAHLTKVEEMIGVQFGYLEKHDIPGFAIDRARADHVQWKRQVAEVLYDPDADGPGQQVDHHSCRFGRWYDAVDDRSLAHNPEFRALGAPHEQVHQHGQAALAARASGDMDRAWVEFAAMEKASERMLDLLARLGARYEINHTA